MPIAILANRVRALAGDARLGLRLLARRWHRLERTTRARIEFGAVFSLLPLSAAIAAIAAAPAALDLDRIQPQPIVEAVATPSIVDQVEELLQREDNFVREARVERGDTLATLLARLEVRDDAALGFLRKEPRARPLVQLAPGRFVQANATADGQLNWLRVYLSGDFELAPGTARVLTVTRAAGGFVASETDLALERRVELRSGEVRLSLFGATDDAGIPDSIAQQMVDALESELDFHRDLRRGDAFRVVYEALYASSGEYVRPGRLLGVEFVNDGKRFDAYWYADGSKNGGYFALDGRSTKRGFLRSPLEYTRISSGFSASRAHPLFGYNAAHRGVDYAAPSGARIRAVAAGSIRFAGWMNGYGNVVEIQHDRHSTLYAHLSKIGPGVRAGGRIGQGDLVGLVGMTGWATGPHLHFELKANGVQVNPITAALPNAMPLAPAQLAAFRASAMPLREQLSLLERVTLAQNASR